MLRWHRSSLSLLTSSRRGCRAASRRRSTTGSAGRRRTSTAWACSRGHAAPCTRSPRAAAKCSLHTPNEWISPCSRNSPSSQSSGRQARRPGSREPQPWRPRSDTATPEERIEAAYHELREALIAEVRDRIAAMPPMAFEDPVLDVLHAMGYGDGTEHSRLRVGGSGDAGIDGVIREDRLGLDVVYVQAKRWGATVGRPVVQGFVGALQGARATKGIMCGVELLLRRNDVRGRRVTARDPGRRRATLRADDRPQRRRDRPRDLRRKRVDGDYFADEE